MTGHNHLEKSQNKEDNSACIFCNNLLCNLESGESWIKCAKCDTYMCTYGMCRDKRRRRTEIYLWIEI